MAHYIWEQPSWPQFTWQSDALLKTLGDARMAQGRLLAEAEFIGLELKARVMEEDTLSTARIEGIELNPLSIRSSVARRLGLPTVGLPPAERHVEGLVEMLHDATSRYGEPLTSERLMGWHAALFPTGYSGSLKITVGDWRPDKGPMQVVSGPFGKEKVHYEAPPAAKLEAEMSSFLNWWRTPPAGLDGMIRAAVAHFWFVTIHPFEDGNGRIARAIGDMALAQDEKTELRLYSVSAQILEDRNSYYEVLEETQKGDQDITPWVVWFLECLERSISSASGEVKRAIMRAKFWQQAASQVVNDRQKKVINRLLEVGPGEFEGGLNVRKYVSLTRISRETAKRDIADLLAKGILRKNPGGGRSTSYDLVWPEPGAVE